LALTSSFSFLLTSPPPPCYYRSMAVHDILKRISDYLWELPQTYKPGMRVSGRIYATEKLMEKMEDGVLAQTANVAMLPGIVKHAYCMPDGHWGYGFPIGGAAAVDTETGVISPGGIGFDINCGMRLCRTNLTIDQVRPKLKTLVDKLYKHIPAGTGTTSKLKLSKNQFCDVIEQGAKWCVEKGYGWPEDLQRTENNGCIASANAAKVSQKAIERGLKQVGTLGSGNHYLEIQVARKNNIYDRDIAEKFGIDRDNQVVIMFHCGSRGFGHQVATDYLKLFLDVMNSKYNLNMPDRELACAPFNSPEGQDYFAAMGCAINMAFANRQMILHFIREVFAEVFATDPAKLGMHQIYDVCHNTAKVEKHNIDGKIREVLIHRKGATRAFGPGNPELPDIYQSTGQPVIIGGSMETGSYLLAGVQTADQTFFTTAHGSGRAMSRTKAKKTFNGRDLLKKMEKAGTYVRCVSLKGLAEEAGDAYKNVDDVVEATELAGISKRVVRFKPIGNVKG